MLIENTVIDLDMYTMDSEYTPLCAACMAGHFEVVQMLCENGAEVNYMNSMGQSPLIFCFNRMTETTNFYENKNICIKIAEVLLQYGADID
mmetsp:Transcript_28458/g.20555  ORF Transcript_28458/g.20555 Transcript_28458/m.20555 type:complete len:91 (+) Transcript_28458:245-517(+)